MLISIYYRIQLYNLQGITSLSETDISNFKTILFQLRVLFSTIKKVFDLNKSFYHLPSKQTNKQANSPKLIIIIKKIHSFIPKCSVLKNKPATQGTVPFLEMLVICCPLHQAKETKK